jgi:hypothetical protein
MLFKAPTILDRTTAQSQFTSMSNDRLGDSLLGGKCLYEFLTGTLSSNLQEHISKS